jgi:formylglycine-generating enzyme required for sulfatase activity
MKVILASDFALDIQIQKEFKMLRMIWVSPGVFMMGERRDVSDYEYQQPFQASISKGFWLGQYLVTQAHWIALMRHNPSRFQYNKNCPVENVNWYDAMEFCDRLNQVYANEIPVSYRFSLPTEAQWEYACRAGTLTNYYNGDSDLNIGEIAWYKKNSDGSTHPVGEKAPNAWGFYDMCGNVDEWCFDALDDYPSEPTADWIGSKDKKSRIVRGGGWGNSGESGSLGSGFRTYPTPESKRSWIGFRLCLRYVQT